MNPPNNNNSYLNGTSAASSTALSFPPVNGEGRVDARALHFALEVKSDFWQWFGRRTDEFGFIEGEDYQVVSSKNEVNASRPLTAYMVTLDTAKELAMVERTEKGRQIRRYFIECEKRLHQPQENALPQGGDPMRNWIVSTSDVILAQDARITQLETQIQAGPEWISIMEWARQEGFGDIRSYAAALDIRVVRRHAEMRVPIGEDRSPSGCRRRTFRPDIVAATVGPCLRQWLAAMGERRKAAPAPAPSKASSSLPGYSAWPRR